MLLPPLVQLLLHVLLLPQPPQDLATEWVTLLRLLLCCGVTLATLLLLFPEQPSVPPVS